MKYVRLRIIWAVCLVLINSIYVSPTFARRTISLVQNNVPGIYQYTLGGSEYFGNKGCSMATMAKLLLADRSTLPVPSAIILGSGYAGVDISSEELKEYVANIENKTGKIFGNSNNPLLLSVRSSPPVSMPGVLDTVTNVGMNKEVLAALTELHGEEFAYSTYCNFIRSFSTTVFNIDNEEFSEISFNADIDTLRELSEKYQEVVNGKGFEIPDNQYLQLDMAMKAVFNSWNSERAQVYRAWNEIPNTPGTAVIIQEMKFGNLNENSGSFVLYTRNPYTGEEGIFCKYLRQRQGDDLVGGMERPISIEEAGFEQEILDQLNKIAQALESKFNWPQEIEGIMEDGELFLLQTRFATFSPEIIAKLAVEIGEKLKMPHRGSILSLVDIDVLSRSLERSFVSPNFTENPIATGIAASHDVISGRIVFSEEKLREYASRGEGVISVFSKNERDKISLIFQSDGILTNHESEVCHIAVIAKRLGKPAVIGMNALDINLSEGYVVVNGVRFNEGDVITIDGNTGDVYKGEADIVTERRGEDYINILLNWSKELESRGVPFSYEWDSLKLSEFNSQSVLYLDGFNRLVQQLAELSEVTDSELVTSDDMSLLNDNLIVGVPIYPGIAIAPTISLEGLMDIVKSSVDNQQNTRYSDDLVERAMNEEIIVTYHSDSRNGLKSEKKYEALLWLHEQGVKITGFVCNTGVPFYLRRFAEEFDIPMVRILYREMSKLKELDTVVSINGSEGTVIVEGEIIQDFRTRQDSAIQKMYTEDPDAELLGDEKTFLILQLMCRSNNESGISATQWETELVNLLDELAAAPVDSKKMGCLVTAIKEYVRRKFRLAMSIESDSPYIWPASFVHWAQPDYGPEIQPLRIMVPGVKKIFDSLIKKHMELESEMREHPERQLELDFLKHKVHFRLHTIGSYLQIPSSVIECRLLLASSNLSRYGMADVAVQELSDGRIDLILPGYSTHEEDGDESVRDEEGLEKFKELEGKLIVNFGDSIETNNSIALHRGHDYWSTTTYQPTINLPVQLLDEVIPYLMEYLGID